MTWAGRVDLDHLRSLPDGSLSQAEVGWLLDEIVWLRERVQTIEREGRNDHQVIAILVRKLGGEVVITDREAVEVESQPRIETFKTNDQEGTVLRVI